MQTASSKEGAPMTTLFVQSRWNPPGQIPLPAPEELPRTLLEERVKWINWVGSKRPLNDFEIDELDHLEYILQGPGRKITRKWRATPEELEAIESELLS